MEDLGKALYNLQRFQVLQTKVNPQTSNYIPNDYAYAWYAEIFPLLNEGGFHEALEKHFKITSEQVDVITQYADSEWLEQRYYNFYEYEKYFEVRSGNKIGIDRSVLLSVFKYMYLREAFDKDFWTKLLEPMKHPVEAQGIIRKFDVDSIYFI
jgi:hypothetical protein